jgi:large subunit ribosomal protein L34
VEKSISAELSSLFLSQNPLTRSFVSPFCHKRDFSRARIILFAYKRHETYNLSARKLNSEGSFMRKTYQPSKIKHANMAGFRARQSTNKGRKVLAARRAKGRAKIAD